MQPFHSDGVGIIIMKFLPWQLSTFIAFHRGSRKSCGLEESWKFVERMKKVQAKKKSARIRSLIKGTITILILNISHVHDNN